MIFFFVSNNLEGNAGKQPLLLTMFSILHVFYRVSPGFVDASVCDAELDSKHLLFWSSLVCSAQTRTSLTKGFRGLSDTQQESHQITQQGLGVCICWPLSLGLSLPTLALRHYSIQRADYIQCVVGGHEFPCPSINEKASCHVAS